MDRGRGVVWVWVAHLGALIELENDLGVVLFRITERAEFSDVAALRRVRVDKPPTVGDLLEFDNGHFRRTLFWLLARGKTKKGRQLIVGASQQGNSPKHQSSAL